MGVVRVGDAQVLRNCSGWKLIGVGVICVVVVSPNISYGVSPWMANILGWYLSEFHLFACHPSAYIKFSLGCPNIGYSLGARIDNFLHPSRREKY